MNGSAWSTEGWMLWQSVAIPTRPRAFLNLALKAGLAIPLAIYWRFLAITGHHAMTSRPDLTWVNANGHHWLDGRVSTTDQKVGLDSVGGDACHVPLLASLLEQMENADENDAQQCHRNEEYK